MINLIKQIELSWLNKETLLDIDPNICLGLFDFRNKVINKYKNN